MTCRCGRPSDGWPSKDGTSDLCQDCWETQADAEWWENLTEPGWMLVFTEENDGERT